MALLARMTYKTFRSFRTGICLALGVTVGWSVAAQSPAAEGPVPQTTVDRRVVITGVPEAIQNDVRAVIDDAIETIESGGGKAADVADSAYAVEQFLRDQGYAGARVEYKMYRITAPGTRVQVRTAAEWPSVRRVEFLVTAGRKTYFGTFRFVGNEHFTDEELAQQMPAGSEAGAQALPAGRTLIPYRKNRIDSALRRIRDKYTLAGFIDAEVGPFAATPRDEGGARFIDIEIPIDEGVRYGITSVDVVVSGVPPAVTAQLQDGLGLIDAVYFPRQVVVGETRVIRILGDAGYRPEVDAETSLSENGQVSIVYRVTPGPLHLFGRLGVSSRSNESLRTRPRFITRLAPFEPNEIVTTSDLQSFENRLYSLGIFSFVDITESQRDNGSEEDTEATTVISDIDVGLEEGRSRYVEVAAGWGSYELLRGRINYTDNNLFGRALSWSTTGAVSFRTRELSSSLTDQTLLGPDVRLTVDGAYGFRDGPSYDRTRTSAGIATFYTPTDYWEFDTSYRYSFTRADTVTAAIEGEEDDALTTGVVGAGLGYDDRDSVLIPTHGFRTSLHGLFAYSLVGSEIDFWGLDTESAAHVHLTDGTFLSIRGEFRTRILLEDRSSLPIQERLFLGGNRSVRSFVEDRLGPAGADGDPLGGLTSVLGSVEIRQRLFGDLFIAGFYDIGSIGERSWDVTGAYGSAIGIGLRYHLPIGPLRLDGAFNPGDTFTQNRRWAIHFAIGFSF
jgi:outer membrane protein insertion porin family